jgi:hypothetical protein
MAFLFGKWLKNMHRRLAPGATIARSSKGTRVVPRLESLEDRTVPSTLTVTSAADTAVAGDGSLRGEIAAARSGDTIQFAPSLAGQTITLAYGELAISKSLNIEGLGASQLTISGNNQDRVFDITASNASVIIAGLTISDGMASYGGGINNAGTLTVNDCTLSGNVAYFWDAYASNAGGAIANSGTLTLNNSTISGNKAVGRPGYVAPPTTTGSGGVGGGSLPAANGLGGGIYTSGGTLSINSSTIANNEATGGSTGGYGSAAIPGLGDGGGLYSAGGTVAINNSTLAGGESDYGGGIFNYSGLIPLKLHDTILADNTAGGGADLYGNIISLGHNLIGNTTWGTGFAASDLLNVNPQLGTLQNNGGPTQTMALLTGSPAIDAGDNASAPAFDQRGTGFPRIVGGTIDIGAFEVQSGNSNQAGRFVVAGFPSVITAGNAGSFTVTALNADGTTDTSYTGTVHFTSSDSMAGLPADYSFTAADAGTHTFSATFKTAGTQSITATDTASTSITGTDGGITVNPAASKFIIVTPSSVTAGTPFSLTVTVVDAYGNVVTGYTGTIRFNSTDNKATLPADYTFTAADGGSHTFTGLSLRKRGHQKITITDTHSSSLVGSVSVSVL